MKFKKMSLILGGILMSCYAKAESELCSDSRYATLNKHQCATVASGGVAATSSGIYAAKKFQTAKLIEQNNTEKIFIPTNPGVSNISDIRNISKIVDGDKVTILYQLSESENRAYHIDLMLSEASSAEATADFHKMQAFTATRAVYETETSYDSNGNTTSSQVYKGQEPDYAARSMHASLALDYEREARKFREKAAVAQRGGPVPVYDFDKVIDHQKGNLAKTVSFLEQSIAKESRITGVLRLPAKYNHTVKNIARKGTAGIVGMLGGLIFIGEEVMSGIVADKIKKGLSVDIEMQNYNDYSEK